MIIKKVGSKSNVRGSQSPTPKRRKVIINRKQFFRSNFDDAKAVLKASMVRKATSAPTSKYQSAYRPRRNIENSQGLQYESFKFFRIEYEVEEDGTIYTRQKEVAETIEIANGWQKHKNGGKPMEGYISKGLSKFVFRVKFIVYHDCS